MSLCSGTRQGYKLLCNGSQYKCTACGQVGCTQNRADYCSGQAFLSTGQCVKCGAQGTRELLSNEATQYASTLMKDSRTAA